MYNKKVLLRERKRHTARRVAIAISCYCWGGGSLDKKCFPVWTCFKPNLVSKFFPFTGGGGGSLDKKIFSPVWTCIKPNLVSKIFPFTGGGSLDKDFFPVWTCIKPNLVSKFFPFTGGGEGGESLDKKFFPVWTCIKPNLVSKNFPFTGGGESLDKNFFSGLNMYQAKSGVKNFYLYWDRVPPPPKVWTDTQTGVKTLPSLVLRTRAVIMM